MQDNLNDSVSVVAMCAAQDETDIGNGNRFRLRYGHDVLSIAKIGWHGFDGLRWREDEDGSVVRPLAHRTAEAIRFECAEIVPVDGEILVMEAGDDAEAEMERLGGAPADGMAAKKAWAALVAAVKARDLICDKLDDRRSSRAKYGKSSQNSAKLDNMLKEAAPYLSRTVDTMNVNAHALNVRNGTLHFVRVEDEESDPEDRQHFWRARLDPHRREDFITKLCEASVLHEKRLPDSLDRELVVADPSSGIHFDTIMLEAIAHKAAPTFFEFLHRVQPDIEMRAYLRRWFGYMLTGLTGEQVIVFFCGIGANGKSTLTDLVAKIMADYSVTMGIESFTGDVRRGGADATPDLARLNGAYGCFASEGDESARLKEGLIKLLTGDDKISVRKLHQDFVEIAIKAKFIITGNHKPIIKGDDDGIWRRVHIVDFPVQIPREERDRDLPDKLLAERDGVLAWMLAGAVEYFTLGGLHPPQSVLLAVQEHREESDPVSAYIRGGCEVTGDNVDSASPGELYDGYVVFCRREGLTPFGASTFNRRLPDKAKLAWKGPDGRMRQFVRQKSGGTIYRGIRVISTFRPGADGDPGDGRPFAPPQED